ncbi:MAG: L-threonylcarbamoyladenylate synthase [Myxococcaceae bacterium]
MSSQNPADIQRAIEILRLGGLVALPTETVYGLAADADNELAVRRIFAVKGRPATHPLIVHVPSTDVLSDWALDIPPDAHALAKVFWPGPLTLVLRRAPRVLDAVTGGQDTVALRVPSHPSALAVLREFQGGLAAPSANRFGAVSPTTAAHVRADLGVEVDLILDGGPSTVGVESTIVDLSHGAPVLLRPGGVGKEELERVLGRTLPLRTSSEVRAPGLLPSHYAPRAGVLLTEDPAAALEGRTGRIAVLAPENVSVPSGVTTVRVPADAAGFARELYAKLRELDLAGVELIIAVPPPESGLGLAVRDRLKRASTPRPASTT